MPSKVPPGETRGWIVPIGGAENKENDRRILERFLRVSGGTSANIVVIPTASRMHGPVMCSPYPCTPQRARHARRDAGE